MIDKFNNENKDNIEVETVWRTGDWQTGLKTSLLAGQGPTVMTNHGISGFDPYIDNIIEAWDNYISPEFSKKYDVYKYRQNINGEIKAYSETTSKLIYNKDIFKKVGEANPPATWDEVRRIAKKITEYGKGDIYGTAYPVGKGQIGLWVDTLGWKLGTVNWFDYGKARFDLTCLSPVVKVFSRVLKIWTMTQSEPNLPMARWVCS